MRSLRAKFNLLMLLVFGSSGTFGYLSYKEYRAIEKKQNEISLSLSLRGLIYEIEPDSETVPHLHDLRKRKGRIDDPMRRNAMSNFIQAYSTNNPTLFNLRKTELIRTEKKFYRKNRREVFTLQKNFRNYLAAALLLPFLGFGILFYFFNYRIVHPLSKLSRKMMEFLLDQYTFRFSNPDQSEIGNLERTFNSLAQKVLNNIDELKSLDRAKSEFVSIASHELRTPLTSIKGSLGMLTTGIAGEMDSEARDLVSVADRETDRLVRLINELLDLAKIESRTFSLKKEWTLVSELVRDSIEGLQGFARAAEVILEGHGFDKPIEISIDKDRIQQVITNLISNAIKYSPKGEKVRVHYELSHQKNIFISVIDQGPGISKENQAHIFEKFRQATNSSTPLVKGTGLGLAISKALVEEHGGGIGIESQLGAGCRFYFNLKDWRIRPEEPPAENKDPAQVLTLKSKNSPEDGTSLTDSKKTEAA